MKVSLAHQCTHEGASFLAPLKLSRLVSICHVLLFVLSFRLLLLLS